MTPSIKTALEFIDEIKEAYRPGLREYYDFLEVMKDFRGGRVDQQETHRRVIALFQRHPELIEGYAVFIPPGHTIDIPADPRGNVFVTVPTGTMEIARDGTVVNDAHMMTAPELQRQETEASGLSEQKKRLLETLRARIADSEEEEFKAFLASFEANLTISPEQKKASLDAGRGREFVEKLQGLLGDNEELKKALSEVLH